VALALGQGIRAARGAAQGALLAISSAHEGEIATFPSRTPTSPLARAAVELGPAAAQLGGAAAPSSAQLAPLRPRSRPTTSRAGWPCASTSFVRPSPTSACAPGPMDACGWSSPPRAPSVAGGEAGPGDWRNGRRTSRGRPGNTAPRVSDTRRCPKNRRSSPRGGGETLDTAWETRRVVSGKYLGKLATFRLP
jgi:hypothetical protein